MLINLYLQIVICKLLCKLQCIISILHFRTHGGTKMENSIYVYSPEFSPWRIDDNWTCICVLNVYNRSYINNINNCIDIIDID